jgi:hypothetical protein
MGDGGLEGQDLQSRGQKLLNSVSGKHVWFDLVSNFWHLFVVLPCKYFLASSYVLA